MSWSGKYYELRKAVVRPGECLLSAYYIPRWKAYFKALEKAVLTGSKFDKDQFRYILKIWHIKKLR
jgi:hypothetical protein